MDFAEAGNAPTAGEGPPLPEAPAATAGDGPPLPLELDGPIETTEATKALANPAMASALATIAHAQREQRQQSWRPRKVSLHRHP